MPLLVLQEGENEKPWKSIAKSVLAPFIPKNKLILREMLKKQENNRNLGASIQMKKSTLSHIQSSHFKSKVMSRFLLHPLQKKQKKEKKICNSFIEDHEDPFSIFCLNHQPKTKDFLVLARRPSCHCALCGKKSGFQSKVDQFFPLSMINIDYQNEKKKRKSMREHFTQERPVEFHRAKTKTKINVVSQSVRSPFNTALNSSNRVSFAKSAMLKSNVNSFSKSNRKSSLHSMMSQPIKPMNFKETLHYDDSVVLSSSDVPPVNKHQPKPKGNPFKSSPRVLPQNQVSDSIKWKYKPTKFLKTFLDKEKISQKAGEDDYQTPEVMIEDKRRAKSFSLLKKEDFINSIYESKSQLRYFKEILQKTKAYSKMPFLISSRADSTNNQPKIHEFSGANKSTIQYEKKNPSNTRIQFRE